ncbi:MAG TPA: alpha/beta family hydrolase [Propionibacteriaceae bacterium]|nr:alpha/beta family hydrolase [Propionibacteriaceae bacterium]
MTPDVPAIRTVDLDDGGRLHVADAVEPRNVLVLGHGASGKIDGADLLALSAALPGEGVTVIRHEQAWKVAGGPMRARPDQLDPGWQVAVRHVAAHWPALPLLVGGHSAGARCACRGSANPQLPAQAGVLALSFPLHPPGRPERSRVDELAGVPVPVTVVQGERDPFGGPDELVAALPDGWFDEPHRTLVRMEGAGHDLVPLKRVMSRDAAMRQVVGAAVDLLGRFGQHTG